jgi:PAS domain S-box-containing protein
VGITGRVKEMVNRPSRDALLGTVFVFMFLSLVGFMASQWYQEHLIKDLRAKLTVETSLRANNISAAIHHRFALLEGLYAFIEAENNAADFAQKLEIYSSALYSSNLGILNISLVPQGGIEYVYPLDDHELLNRYNLFNDAGFEGQIEAPEFYENRNIVLFGLIDLSHGGMGLIFQQAVYLDSSYWGMVNIVTDFSPILEKAFISDQPQELNIALRDSSGRIVFGSAEVFDSSPVFYPIDLPVGYWEIGSLPVLGWEKEVKVQTRIFQAGVLTIILLFSGLVYITINRQSYLRGMVEDRTEQISIVNEELIADIKQREMTENELRASEERLKSLLAVAPDAIIAIDENQRIELFNHAAEKMFGYSCDEVIGQPLALLIPNRFHESHAHHVKRFLKNPIDWQRMDERMRISGLRKDGSEFPAEASISKFISGQGVALTAIVRDISHRMLIETQLREREEQYRSIFDSVSDALFITDTDTGQLIDFNPAASSMHGYSDQEFRELPVAGFVHPDSRQIFNQYLQTVKAGEIFRARAVDLRKDGSTIPIEVFGAPLTYGGKRRILAVVRDITEEIQAYQLLEKRVEERTRELQILLDVSHNVASTLDLNSLLSLIIEQLKRVVDFSALAVSVLNEDGQLELIEYQGPLKQEKISRHWNHLESKIDVDLFTLQEPLIIPDIRAETPHANAWRQSAMEMLGEVPDYVSAWMAVPLLINKQTIGILSFDHGEVEYYTPRHAELALAIANHAAIAIENARLYEQAQRLAAMQERQKLARELHDSVSQALYGIALGARTARTLLDRDPSKVADPLGYCLSLAEAGLAEMRALIFELRPESLENEGLVAALRKQAQAIQARYGIEVKTDLCQEPDISINQKEALYRVAQEAMHNTVKHAAANKIELTLDFNDPEIFLEVADDGSGFDLGRPFPGHLGLNSMRERIERIGGKFELESEHEQGTRIRAWISNV